MSPTLDTPGVIYLQTLRRWRTARVLPASGHLDDDLL